jgi:nucleoside 2-deoxyribosyltransferase
MRIYCAGPEVFLPDPIAAAARRKELCAQYGFEGVVPVDAEINLAGLSPAQAAMRIGQHDEEMIRSCFAIIANITPFRGPSADVGTAYEMGFGRALGLIVSAYSNVSEPFTARTMRSLTTLAARSADGRLRDGDGMMIEEWGIADNLMLESGIAASGGCLILEDVPQEVRYTDLRGFERCLARLRESVRKRTKSQWAGNDSSL